MNHIYKSIFNKALGVFTAVPEFASAHGKGSERTVVGRVAKGTAGFAASALAISVGLALTSTSAVAGPGIYINDGTDTGCLAVPDAQGPNVGIHGISGGVPSAALSLLGPSQVVPDRSYYGLDVMKPCLSSTAANATEERSTQTNRTLFYGKNGPTSVNDNGAKNLTLGGRLDVNSGIIGVGDRGVNGTGATNSIRMGTGTTLDEANKKLNSISIGVDAGASATGSTAIGANAKARAEYSVALGDSAVSGDNTIGAVNGGGGAIAIGRQSIANNYNAIAIGMSASVSPAAGVTTASDGIAIGSETVVDNYKGIAVGAYSQAKGRQSTVIANNVQGSNYSTASGTRSQVYGAETNVSGNNSVAIGDTNTVASDRTYVMGNNINAAAGTQNSLAFGTRASVGGASSIAMGLDSKTNTDGSIAMGLYSEAGGPITNGKPGINATAIGTEAKALGLSAVAMGYRATVENGHDSIAIGVAAKSTNKKSTAIGTLSEASGEQSTVISNNFDAKGGKSISVASGRRSQIYGAETTVSGEQSVAIGDTNTVASARTYALGNNINAAAGTDDSLAFGTRASVQGANTIAVGNTAQALTDDSISIGRDSKAGKVDKFDGKKSIAIGYASEAMGSNAIALGSNAATNNGHDSIAMGTYAKTNGEKTISIGAYNTAEGAQSIVIAGNYDASTGSNRSTTTAAAKRAIVVGPESHATAEDAVAIGNKNTIASARTYAMGNNINVAAGADDSLAFGTRAHVSGANQVSIGTDAGADNTSAGEGNTAGISIGNDAGRYATAGKNNTSIGQRAGQYANGDNNVAIGKDAGSLDAAGAPLTTNTVSIGSSSKVKGQEAIAVGNEAEAISNSAIAIGNSAKGRALYSTAIGLRAKTSDDATMTFGESATAVGHAAAATRYSAAAFGHDSFADGESSVALGYAAKALGTEQIAIGAHAGQNRQGTQTGANFSVAIGRSAGGDAASALGNHSGVSVGLDAGRYLQDGSRNTAVGGYAGQYVKGSYNVALGHGAGSGTATEHLEASETISIGHNSKASAAYSTAIGTNANAAQANSVALGAGSTTSDVHTGDYTLNGSYTAAGLPKVANGTVSVGSRLRERQIQNVAAGVISSSSTDAINGSQLYATNFYLTNIAGDVKTTLGGNAALGNDGHLTMTNIGGTGENTVDDAIKNLKTAIDNKADTTASVTSENPADIKVDKEAPVGNTTNYKLSLGNDAKAKLAKAATALQTVEGDSNITATKDATDPTKVKLALNKNLTADSLTLGNTAGDHAVVNKDGLTIANGPSVKKEGINAGDKVISGVADGNIAAGSKEAVNGGQLAEVKSKADSAVQNVVSANPTALTATKAGDTVTLTPNFIAGDLVNPATGAVNTPAAGDAGKLVTAGTIANALANTHFVVDTAKTDGELDAASKHDQKIKSGNKVTLQAGKNLKAKQTNAADGATVEFSLKDSISLTQVTAGTGANQVVLGNDGVKVGGNTYINNDGLNANSKVISNVAAGVKPTDAVNKGQLDAVKNVADSAVQSVDVAANENNLVVDNNDPKNPKLRLRKAVDLDSIKLENNVGEKSFLNSAGLTIKDGPAVTRSGINANNTKVTNVTDGDVNSTSKDAVNGSQLYNVASNVADLVGPDAKIDPATGKVTVADPTKGIGETGKDNIGDAIKAVNKAATAAKTTVKEGDNITVTPTTNTDGSTTYTVATKKDLDVTSVTAGNTTVNTNGLTITGGPSVTRGGIDAGDRVISGVKAGDVSANSKEAVNGSQLYATNTKLDGVKAKADTAVQDVKSGDENALTAVKDPNTNIVTVTPKLSGDLVDADGNITAPTTPADKGKLVTAGTVAQALANTHFVVDTKATDGELDSTSQADQKIKAGNKVTLQAGKNLKAKQTNGADGAQVEFSLKDSISLTQVTAGEGDNQVVLGNDGVKVGGNTYINKDGLNANNKPISNVADGVKPTDAVNKGQLDAVKGVADSAVKSVDVANGEQNLVVDNTDPKNPKLSLKKDLTVDSVKAGDSTLNTDGLTIAGGPSVKKDGINAGNKKITGVADGNVAAGSTDAVNGGQLYNVANNVKDLIGPDATIDPATGKVTVADPAQGIAGTGKGTIGEAIKSVKDKADTAVQDIKSGDEKALSVTKAGNTYTITPNLSGDLVDADGNITAPATDADKGKLVTAGTVADALANTHFVVDTKATDGELDAASQADQKIKAGNKVTLQAGKNLKAKQTNGANGAQVEFSLKDSISLKEVTAGEGANQVVLGNDGVKVGGNTYINNAGLNANGNKITNVADGVDPTDAVNKGQLDAVKTVADSAVKSVDVVANENNLVVDNTDPKNPKLRLRKAVDLDSIKLENNVGEKSFLNSAGLTIKDGPAVTRSGINANNTKVTNVTDGDVNGTSKDAVNGSQLYNVASNVKDLIGPDAAIDPATGKVTVADPTKGIGGTGKGNIGDAIQSVKDAADKAAAEHTTVKAGNNIVVTEGTNAAGGKEYTVSTAKDLNVDSVKAGDTTVNNDGLTIAGGPSVKKDGIDAGDKNITNVADGNVAAGSKDAVNGGQLYDVAKNVADLVGPDATIDPATGKVTVADPTKGIGETGKGTIGDAIKAVNDLAKKAAVEKTSVKAKDGRSNVTVTEGTNAAGGHEYTVDVERVVTEAGSDQVTVTSKHDADSNTTTYTVDVSDKTKASLAKADSAVQGLTSKDGNLNFNKGPNGNVEVSFNDNLNVKNITTDGVKAGDTTINSNGIEIVNGPSMTKDGINAAGKAISNVANGNVAKGSKDAVNGGQLHETAQSVADVIGGGATVKDGKVVAGQNGIGNTGQNTVHGAIAAINQNTANNFNQIRGDLRKMDRDLRGGIAGALATAGLPQAFRPGKSMVAAAASTYRGQSGLAIGVSRISDNGKVILKVTGNTNSRGDFGGTIGAGYQW